MNTTFSVPVGLGSVIGTDGVAYPVVGGQVTMPENAVSSGMFASGFSKPGATVDSATIITALGYTPADAANLTGLLKLKSNTDTSGNPNYPAATTGDAYYVTVAGKIGGASGVAVDIGDVYAAKADNAGGTQASVGTSWFVLEHNLVGALLTSQLDTDGTLAGNSDAKIATQKATKTKIDALSTSLAAIATSGSASDLSAGTVAAARMPALTGDATSSAGSVATTLATVNSNVGSFGSATQSLSATVDGKGRITAISAQTVTPAVGSITGFGTGIATALAINIGSAGAPVVYGGALGSPSSGVATNLTGTAAGLTAGNVTTNANLTGPITSVGNATSIASQTGTGTKFVVDTNPVLIGPTLGAATATSVNKVAITGPATSATLTLIDGTTVTGPSVTGTLAILGANTFVATQSITPAADAAALAISSYSVTGSGTSSALSVAGTWNTTGAPFAVLLAMTDTASSGNAGFLQCTVAGAGKFTIRKTGETYGGPYRTNAYGSAGTCEYALGQTTNTGMFGSTNAVRFSCGGTEAFNSSATIMAFAQSLIVGWGVLGVSNPDIAFSRTDSNGAQVNSGVAGTFRDLTLRNAIANHLIGRGTAPTVTGNGSSNGSIAGTDAFSKVTVGTGSTTSIVITFGTAYATAPVCVVNAQTTTTAINVVTTTTTATLTCAAFTAGEVLSVVTGGF